MSEQLYRQQEDYAVQVPQEAVASLTGEPEILRIVGNVIDAAPMMAEAWKQVQDYAEKQRELCEEIYPRELERLVALRGEPARKLAELLIDINKKTTVVNELESQKHAMEHEFNAKQAEKRKNEIRERNIEAQVRAYESNYDSWRDNTGAIHRISNQDRMYYLQYEGYGHQQVSPRDKDQLEINRLVAERQDLDNEILDIVRSQTRTQMEIDIYENTLVDMYDRKAKLDIKIAEIDENIYQVLNAYQLLREQLGRSMEASEYDGEPNEEAQKEDEPEVFVATPNVEGNLYLEDTVMVQSRTTAFTEESYAVPFSEVQLPGQKLVAEMGGKKFYAKVAQLEE